MQPKPAKNSTIPPKDANMRANEQLFINIFHKFLHQHRCQKVTDTAELNFISAKLEEHAVLVASFCCDVIANGPEMGSGKDEDAAHASRDHAIIASHRMLTDLQTHHLKTYHAKDAEDSECSCVFWLRSQQMKSQLDIMRGGTLDRVQAAALFGPELQMMPDRNFWIDVLRANAVFPDNLPKALEDKVKLDYLVRMQMADLNTQIPARNAILSSGKPLYRRFNRFGEEVFVEKVLTVPDESRQPEIEIPDKLSVYEYIESRMSFYGAWMTFEDGDFDDTVWPIGAPRSEEEKSDEVEVAKEESLSPVCRAGRPNHSVKPKRPISKAKRNDADADADADDESEEEVSDLEDLEELKVEEDEEHSISLCQEIYNLPHDADSEVVIELRMQFAQFLLKEAECLEQQIKDTDDLTSGLAMLRSKRLSLIQDKASANQMLLDIELYLARSKLSKQNGELLAEQFAALTNNMQQE